MSCKSHSLFTSHIFVNHKTSSRELYDIFAWDSYWPGQVLGQLHLINVIIHHKVTIFFYFIEEEEIKLCQHVPSQFSPNGVIFVQSNDGPCSKSCLRKKQTLILQTIIVQNVDHATNSSSDQWWHIWDVFVILGDPLLKSCNRVNQFDHPLFHLTTQWQFPFCVCILEQSKSKH